jgi:hypothetical protein
MSLAKSLGHDPADLSAGKEIRTKLIVHNLAELKAALNPDNRTLPVRTIGPHSGILGQILSYVHGGQATLPANVVSRVEPIFPLALDAISASTKSLANGEVWDLGTSASPVVVNLGTLTMNPGSSIRIQNTVLNFTVDTLVRNAGPTPPPTSATGTITFTAAGSKGDSVTINGVAITLVTSGPTGNEILIGGSASATATNLQAFLAGSADPALTVANYTVSGGAVAIVYSTPGAAGNVFTLAQSSTAITLSGATLTGGWKAVNYDIGIFGATGSTGPAGNVGHDGGAGTTGIPGTCTSGGGIAGDAGGAGGTGSKGATGGPGQPGGDGLPALPASISITTGLTGNAGQLVVLTRSGTGGMGGFGGRAGQGGAGGAGGGGAECGCEATNGGPGGVGGNGGRGGTGGTGGNGVNGSDIHVNLPVAQTAMIKQIMENAPFGKGGPGGTGGGPGGGGAGGGKGKSSISYDGGGGGAGSGGTQGPNGHAGALNGSPGQIYVNVS